MRLQKFLSEQGICSRRKGETYILEGKVKVNGITVTELGVKIDPDRDIVELDPSISTTKHTYIAFFKPRGIVTNCPVDGEQDIRSLLPKNLAHVHSIGRLDKDSEGLILLTDDGIFAKKLLDPNHPFPKDYLVWVNATFTQEMADKLEDGITIFGRKTKPCQIKILDECYFKIILNEGKNRQIRRMVQEVDRFVVRLKRVCYGPIRLDKLPRGEFRHLTSHEIKLCLSS